MDPSKYNFDALEAATVQHATCFQTYRYVFTLHLLIIDKFYTAI
jgi:hypothetical protein